MSDDENCKKSGSGKLLAGLVIGGAIASVLGWKHAPKKTKKVLKQKAKKILEKVEEKIHELEENEE
jgi:gas vesicle protein